MSLCFAWVGGEVTGSKDQVVFKPQEQAFAAADTQLPTLLHSFLNKDPMAQADELVLDTKSAGGDPTGVGAVWTTHFTKVTQSRDHGTQSHQFKMSFTVVDKQPGTSIKVKSEQTKQEHWCNISPTLNPETYLTITLSPKGNDTLATVKVSSTMPGWYKGVPPMCIWCPVFWIYLIPTFVCCVVCAPCCSLCCESTLKTSVNTQCDQLMGNYKNICEKAPANQMMSDSPHNNAIPMATPIALKTGASDQAFCSKCGTQRPGPDSTFCAKCGGQY